MRMTKLRAIVIRWEQNVRVDITLTDTNERPTSIGLLTHNENSSEQTVANRIRQRIVHTHTQRFIRIRTKH